MKKLTLCLATASLFASGAAWAEDYRLAFSKAENIEIFVENASKADWCAPQLDLRVVYGSAPNQDALATLMPKLGALLGKQCAKATEVKWVSWNSKGERQAQGSSTKANGWALVADKPAAEADANNVTVESASSGGTDASADAAKEGVDAAPDTAAAPAAKPAQPESADAASTTVDDVLAAAGVTAKPAEGADSKAPAADAAPEQTEETAKPAEQAPAADKAQDAPEQAAADKAEEAPAQEAAPAPQTDFAVNGWKPLSQEEAMKKASFLSTMTDQNGCKVVTLFKLGDQADYMSLTSENLQCGPDGYATGTGRLVLERSDGARMARTQVLWFAHGMPFNKEVQAVPLADTDGKGTLWFRLGSDAATRSHFLLRARTGGYDAINVWQLQPRVDVVTEQGDRFRQAPQIRQAVEQSLEVLQGTAMPWAYQAHLVFAKDFEEGLVQDKGQALLYSITASRSYDWRSKRGKGAWKYNMQSATNFVFREDERIAREKRAEEQRKERERQYALRQKANEERNKLSQYQNMVEQAKQNPKRLLESIISDVRYTPIDGGSYASLAQGDSRKVSLIVRVSDDDDGDAKVDWPYDMRLVGQADLEEKWYLVSGEVSLDKKRRDDEGLPLTLLTSEPGAIVACEKEGCSDMADPLAMMRMKLGDPSWSPEVAQEAIKASEQASGY